MCVGEKVSVREGKGGENLLTPPFVYEILTDAKIKEKGKGERKMLITINLIT